MSLTALIKRLRDIMRKDSGVDGDAQRLAQIVWLIFLKVLDYKEEEAELTVDGYVPIVPKGYRWRDWAVGESAKDQLTGPDLLDFINNKLIPVLGGNAITINGEKVVPFEKTDARSMMVKDFMGDCINYMKNGYLLRDVVNLFNEVDLEDSGKAHEFNDMYESLLKGLQSAGSMGEFYTNRAITEFAISKVNPQLGGTLADWAMGTGGFLVSALNHMQAQVTPGDVKAQEKLQKAVRGGELKPMAYKLGITNLLLNGIELPNVRYGDSLAEKNLNEFKGNDLVEYCALNPPYGGVALPEDLQSFPTDLRSSETADLFMALAVRRLKNGGRGVIVLPDGFLFGNDNAKIAIKKYLLKECNLHTIIRLPQSCFAPYTSIATNLLFFDKGENTQEIWYYRLDMPEGYKHFSKTKPMQREHFACVDEWWDNRKEIIDEKEDEALSTTYKSKCYSIAEIEANGYNLDLCGYPVEEKIILSPEETIKNYIEEKRSLEEKLKTATNNLQAYLSGDYSVQLINIKSLSDKIGALDSAFPDDMKSALLQSAMQGKLTEQLPEDGNAIDLLVHIKAEKELLIKERKIKKQKALPLVSEDEIPFDIPKNWEWCRLGLLVTVISGTSYDKSKVQSNGLRIARGGNLINERITILDDDVFLPKEDYYDLTKCIQPKDIVIVASTGSLKGIGRPAFCYSSLSEEIQIGAFLRIVRCINADLFSYISKIFQGYYYKSWIQSCVKGIGIRNMKEEFITNMLIPVPPLAEQKRIVEKLDKLLPLCDSLRTELY